MQQRSSDAVPHGGDVARQARQRVQDKEVDEQIALPHLTGTLRGQQQGCIFAADHVRPGRCVGEDHLGRSGLYRRPRMQTAGWEQLTSTRGRFGAQHDENGLEQQALPRPGEPRCPRDEIIGGPIG